MDKDLCFRIEQDDLFLYQVLVDYDRIPIFFLCKGKEKNYLVLCVDCENYNYIVVEVSLFNIYDLLHGNISMRDAILKHKEYWFVLSGIDVSEDIVERKIMKDIDQSWLPKQDECFKVLTESMEQFVDTIDNKLSIQQNNISRLRTGFGIEIRSTIELTQYSFFKKVAGTLGTYSEWSDINLESEIIEESNDRFRINNDCVVAA